MKEMRPLIVIIFLLLLDIFCPTSVLQRVSAHTVIRDVNSISSIHFIDRFVFKPVKIADKPFCYGSNGTDVIEAFADGSLIDCFRKKGFGTAFWKIRYNVIQFPGAQMLVFTDQDKWRDVYLSVYGGYETRHEDRGKHDAFSCKQIVDLADFKVYLGNTKYNEDNWYNKANSYGFYERRSEGKMFFFQGEGSQYDVYGYFVLISCNVDAHANDVEPCNENCQGSIKQVGLDIEYKNKNFLSQDELGMNNVCIVFFVMEVFILCICGATATQLRAIKRFHFVVKILIASIALQVISLLFALVYWENLSSEALNGQKELWALFASIFFYELSTFLFVIFMILIAKGWSIVRKHLSANGKAKIVAYSSIYLFAAIFSAVFDVYNYNPAYVDSNGDVITRYENSAGILIIFVRLFACIWFSYALYTTRYNFPNSKKRFYEKFWVVGTAWMLGMPFMAVITFGIKRGGGFQTRMNVFVFSWESLILSVGHFSFALMFSPTYMQSFPFHHEITEGNNVNDSSFVEVPTSEEAADNSKDQSSSQHEIFRGPSPDDVFMNIKNSGSAVAEKVSTLNNLNERLSSILGDWDHENEEDVAYKPRRRRGYNNQ